MQERGKLICYSNLSSHPRADLIAIKSSDSDIEFVPALAFRLSASPLIDTLCEKSLHD